MKIYLKKRKQLTISSGFEIETEANINNKWTLGYFEIDSTGFGLLKLLDSYLQLRWLAGYCAGWHK